MTAIHTDGGAQVIFKAFPKQEEFFEAALSGKYNFLGYGGAIRGGKSFVAIALLLLLMKVYPGSRWAVVRKDLPTLRRNIIPVIEKLRPTHWLGELNQQTWTYTAKNSSQLILFPESIEKDRELNRWRGLEVNGFDLDEANELQRRSFHKAIERAGAWIIPRTNHQPAPLVLMTFNPSPGWVKTDVYDPWSKGVLKAPYFFVQATALDNPYIPQPVRESWKNLPAREYKRFVLGDWSELQGLALPELNAKVHLLQESFVVPPHWERFGSFDWGYRHPFSFGFYAANEDNDLFLVDSIRGRMLKDEGIFGRVKESLPSGFELPLLMGQGPEARMEGGNFNYVSAGLDCFQRYEARANDNTPTTSERFAAFGMPLTEANVARKQGLRTFNEYLAWQPVIEGGKILVEERTPRFRIMPTPGNLEWFDRVAAIPTDPLDPEDAQKVNADENGEGGDDDFEQTRYALNSRPKAAPSSLAHEEVQMDDPAVLAYEREQKLRSKPPGQYPILTKANTDPAAEAGF